ncbi:MAG: flagellar export chaperone FliS [Thermodesulfobacteriota bacterium]
MYQNQQKVCSQYKKNELENLDPAEIVARLYQALGQSLVSTRQAIVDGDVKVQGEGTSRALAIITELQTGLNMEEGGEIAENLSSLYSYLVQEISRGNVGGKPELIDNAISTVEPLTEAWVELARKRKEEAAEVVAVHQSEKPLKTGAFHAAY